MTRIEFFDAVACGDNPMLFCPEEHAKIQRLKLRLGDLYGARVLEPGCGAGPLTEYLARWVGETGEVFAFDASAAMVNACRRRLADHRNVRIAQALLEEIVLEPRAWALVILFRFFPHVSAREAVLKKLRLALRPEGRLVIANLQGSADLNAWHQAHAKPVSEDYMPSGQETREMLIRCGYAVTNVIDEPNDFYAEARPVCI